MLRGNRILYSQVRESILDCTEKHNIAICVNEHTCMDVFCLLERLCITCFITERPVKNSTNNLRLFLHGDSALLLSKNFVHN